jgi:hypothetical protein
MQDNAGKLLNIKAVAVAEKPPKLPAPRKSRRDNRSRYCNNNNRYLDDLLTQAKEDVLNNNQ